MPRAGRDSGVLTATQHSGVSIHAPRAGRDTGAFGKYQIMPEFQSTRPVRGATQGDAIARMHELNAREEKA